MREGQKTRTARRLRRAANSPEQRAWQTLRQLRGEGLPVRRQHPIGPYVVDFAIVAERLVIEIDGGAHGIPGRADSDLRREAALEASGWQVIRFTAQEALSADFVLERLRLLLAERSSS